MFLYQRFVFSDDHWSSLQCYINVSVGVLPPLCKGRWVASATRRDCYKSRTQYPQLFIIHYSLFISRRPYNVTSTFMQICRCYARGRAWKPSPTVCGSFAFDYRKYHSFTGMLCLNTQQKTKLRRQNRLSFSFYFTL